MSILERITDLELDIACLLDDPEDTTRQDLYDIQAKLRSLANEYILSSTQPD
jgi:hypothetical protein